MMSCLCAGIDVDIDVEHEGNRTKVTPPPQTGGVKEDMETGGASSEGGGSSEGRDSKGSKVSSSSSELFRPANTCGVFRRECFNMNMNVMAANTLFRVNLLKSDVISSWTHRCEFTGASVCWCEPVDLTQCMLLRCAKTPMKSGLT